MMDGVTLHQLLCFDAVVTEGSFQAAADKLLRSQPTISSSVKNLETQLRLSLLDRSGYRVALTDAGRSFYERTRVFLHELQSLRDHAAQLAMGEESELRVVIGDVCPLPEILGLSDRILVMRRGQIAAEFDAAEATEESIMRAAVAGESS